MRGWLNQRRENRVGTQTVWEFPNELLHGRMPETVETEEIHLIHGACGQPVVRRHAVSGHKNARAVVAEEAMHKDFLVRIIAEQCKEARHLFIGWRRPSADG